MTPDSSDRSDLFGPEGDCTPDEAVAAVKASRAASMPSPKRRLPGSAVTCVHGDECRRLSCMYCLCGDDDCWQMAFGSPWCEKCREHHRSPVGDECFLEDDAAMSEPKIPTIEAMHALSVDEVRAHLRRYVAALPADERREVGVLAGNPYAMLIVRRIEFLTGATKADVLREALR